tara:strand:- start:762 stop:1679 length:918 start_codon:yes stop_codon:yes gene_type:complete
MTTINKNKPPGAGKPFGVPKKPFAPPEMPVRQGGFGASDVAVLMGLNPYAHPIKAWLNWFGMGSFKGSALMFQGHRLESEFATEYLEQNPDAVECWSGERVHCPEPVSFCWATPDFIVKDTSGGFRGLEIKAVGARQESRWENGKVPTEYEVQCRWCMLATGLKRWDIHAHFLGSGRSSTVEFLHDEQTESNMVSSVLAFKLAFIDTATPPPRDGESKGYEKQITRAFPLSLPDILETTDDKVQQAFALNRAVSDASAVLSGLKADLKTIMGTSEAMESPWGRITYKTQKNGVRPLKFHQKKEGE